MDTLEPIAIFGFDGNIASGLHVHPNNKDIIFPLGNKVSIINLQTNKQEFLCGHTNTISNIDVSKSGKLLASGQINHMGFRAYVIIWDWELKKEKQRHELHKVRIEALSFTSNEACLITMGGRDDGMLIVWDIDKNCAISGAKTTTEITGDATRLRRLRRRGSDFFSAGDANLRLWTIDREKGKLLVVDVIVGKLRRDITSMRIDSIDEYMYAGTMSGDILKIRLNCHHDPNVLDREKSPILLECFARHNPKKPLGKDCVKYTNGVRDLLIVPNEQLLIGAGDGSVELVEQRNIKFKDYPLPTWPQLKLIKRTQVNGPISSMQLIGTDSVIIGTEACEIYVLKLINFDLKLILTCNTSSVYDIAFPRNFSVVFATASHQSVRIWSTNKKQELLRIMVPNFTATGIVFSNDGKSIISIWNDGVIRSFTPLTGKLIYAIPNAHNKGCSAVALSNCNRCLVTGGVEGQVRVWKLEITRQSLFGVLKEHTSTIGSLDFNKFDTEVVSASTDGTCIIWDIQRLSRKHVLYANTQFTCAQYYPPSSVQILATGTDKRISYWETYDASLVRDIEASTKGPINCLSLNSTGEYFASVGCDQILKIWNYQTGIPVCIGNGHAAVIITCKYSPCGKFIVSGSADGAVFIWAVPEKYWPKNMDPLQEAVEKARKLSIDDNNKTGESSSSPIQQPNATDGSVETASLTKNNNRFLKIPENIKKLESSRSNKDVHISECPPIDLNEQPDVNETCICEGIQSKKSSNSCGSISTASSAKTSTKLRCQGGKINKS